MSVVKLLPPDSSLGECFVADLPMPRADTGSAGTDPRLPEAIRKLEDTIEQRAAAKWGLRDLRTFPRRS